MKDKAKTHENRSEEELFQIFLPEFVRRINNSKLPSGVVLPNFVKEINAAKKIKRVGLAIPIQIESIKSDF